MSSTLLSTSEIVELKKVFHRRLVNPMRIDYESGVFYRGETNTDGLPNGWGEILYKDGTVIAGKWVDGVLCGKGVYMSTEMTYKGDFNNNAFSGKGRQTYHDDGEYYDGQFTDGERNGYGELTLTNGTTYIGYWKDGDFDGVGTLTCHGKVYSGHWQNNCQSKDGFIIRV